MMTAYPLAAQDTNSSDFKNALQKEVGTLIIQASNIYLNASNSSEKHLQTAFAKIIPNWKCPSEFNEDLQLNMPLMYSCFASVTAIIIEGSKTNPHMIKYEGVSYKLTDNQLIKLQADIQTAFDSIKNSTEETNQEYANIGNGVSELVKQLEQTYPDVTFNSMLLTLNLKRLIAYLASSSNFDFKSSFADERLWNAEKDSQAFMAKYFPEPASTLPTK